MLANCDDTAFNCGHLAKVLSGGNKKRHQPVQPQNLFIQAMGHCLDAACKVLSGGNKKMDLMALNAGLVENDLVLGRGAFSGAVATWGNVAEPRVVDNYAVYSYGEPGPRVFMPYSTLY